MDTALQAFAESLQAPDAEIDLGLTALLIAQVEHPGLKVEAYLEALDELALRSGARRAGDALRRLHRLREFLFEEERFQGNTEEYFDPRNSCLNDVLERRLGIPITLSLVLMEIGRRVGLRIDGIGLPGHFVVSATIAGDRMLLDPFHGGAMLTHESAAEVVGRALGRRVTLQEEHFAPVTKRQFLIRMLTNLKAIYCKREAWTKALEVIDRLLVIDPSAIGDVRDRGTVLVHLGQCRQGIAHWERYLTACPHSSDSEAVRQRLRRVRQALASLN
jgi:regulator of sirC expression with transglutaminase-like and TPR domain